MNDRCEYCTELYQPESSRFRGIYRDALRTRILRESSRFVVMPTIGQMFVGSLLLIPKRHIETLASADAAAQEELCALADHLRRVQRPLGEGVVFEHGARQSSGGGCGIYHAHLHLVPLPRRVTADQMLPGGAAAGTLRQALDGLRAADEYLVVEDHDGRTAALDLSAVPHHGYPSQFFRRRLAELLQPDAAWNWRSYTRPERALIETVDFFQNAAVAG